jgi:AcrR family transcriptional regulator
MDMNQDPIGTKLSLILAAGDLFAEYGVEGTSIRTIAEKAGVNIAAVNYHFGSKENLYTETLRYAILHLGGTRPLELFKKGLSIEDPYLIAESLYTFIRGRFISLNAPEKPKWFSKLLIRSLLDPSPSFRSITEQVFLPDLEALTAIIRTSNPKMSKEKAMLWAFSIEGQIAFYIICRMPILITLGKEEYSQAFIDAAAEHIASSIIAALGLPNQRSKV